MTITEELYHYYSDNPETPLTEAQIFLAPKPTPNCAWDTYSTIVTPITAYGTAWGGFELGPFGALAGGAASWIFSSGLGITVASAKCPGQVPIPKYRR